MNEVICTNMEMVVAKVNAAMESCKLLIERTQQLEEPEDLENMNELCEDILSEIEDIQDIIEETSNEDFDEDEDEQPEDDE